MESVFLFFLVRIIFEEDYFGSNISIEMTIRKILNRIIKEITKETIFDYSMDV